MPQESASSPISRAAGALVNADLWTMVTPSSQASAVAWKDGRIVAVGSDDEVRAAALKAGIPEEAIVDVGGARVLPGFVDAHMHFLHASVKNLRPDLAHAESLEDAFERLRTWLAANPGDGGVIAEALDESRWPEPRLPTMAEVDEAVGTDRPIVLRRICGHTAVANRVALPLVRAKWDRDDLVDLATGRLDEEASLYLNEVLPSSDDELDAAVRDACALAHSLGVTALGDYSQAPYRAALLRGAASGDLTVRVASNIYPQFLDDAVAGANKPGSAEAADGTDQPFHTGRPRGRDDGAWLQDGGLKIFLDGSFGGNTAYLREEYADDPGNRGKRNWTDEQLDQMMAKAHAAGIQLHLHVIGDAAIDQGLAAYARLAAAEDLSEGWQHGLRHRFEHYELPHPEAVALTAELGIVASCQPNFVGEWSTKEGMYGQRLGARVELNNRYRDFLAAGVPLAFGSDGMPFGPLRGIDAAVHHPVESQRLTWQEAVFFYTDRAAWSIHRADLGRIEPGCLADLVIVGDTDERPRSWRVEATISDGDLVHGSLPGASS
ncbi:MAG: amidohydrolase [Thermoplasmatota archaeon]